MGEAQGKACWGTGVLRKWNPKRQSSQSKPVSNGKAGEPCPGVALPIHCNVHLLQACLDASARAGHVQHHLEGPNIWCVSIQLPGWNGSVSEQCPSGPILLLQYAFVSFLLSSQHHLSSLPGSHIHPFKSPSSSTAENDFREPPPTAFSAKKPHAKYCDSSD